MDVPALDPLASGRGGEIAASAIIEGHLKDFQDLMATEVPLLSRKLLLRDNMTTFAEYEDVMRRHNVVRSALLDVPIVHHNWAAQIMAKLESLDKKVEGMEKELDGMDKKLEGMGEKFEGMDKIVDGMDNKVEALKKKVEALDKRVEAIGKDVGAMNKTVDELQGFRNILDAKVDDLEMNQTDAIKKELQEFKTITEERHQAFAMQLGNQMDILRGISNACQARISEAERLNSRTQELTGNAVIQQHP